MNMDIDSEILNIGTSANFQNQQNAISNQMATNSAPNIISREFLEQQEQEINVDQQDDDNDWIEEIVEELVHGKIVLGNDGQFYIELEEGKDASNIDLQSIDTVQILVDNDGKQKLLIENSTQRDKLISEKARNKIAETIRKKEEKIGNIQPAISEQIKYSADEFTKEGEEVVQFQEEGEVVEYDGFADVSEFVVPSRRQRVYGHCRCKECGQSFANMARLERHLSVHQQYGAYLCPLCSKTYKYEYNLFYHWRRTCRDMNELLSFEERKVIEINALRQLIEEIAQKKASIGPLELNGISYTQPYSEFPHTQNSAQLTPHNLFGENVVTCAICRLTVYKKHLPRHLDVHKGRKRVDESSVGGAFFCDLCGFMFKKHENLLKHWRTSCTEIMENLPDDFRDYPMGDIELKQLVANLLCNEPSSIGNQMSIDINYTDELGPSTSKSVNESNTSRQHDFQFIERLDHSFKGVSQQKLVHKQKQIDQDWTAVEGIIFADDLMEEMREGTLIIADDGKLVNGKNHRQQQLPAFDAIEASSTTFSRIDQSMNDKQEESWSTFHEPHNRQMNWIQYGQSVQCNECFRSFSSVQRLEKHMAGAHYSFGTHHCLFCGGRFKYEYNLLYHYRHVCKYSLKLLSKDARQQMEAADLKKTIRQISTRGEHQINNSLGSKNSIVSGMEGDGGQQQIQQMDEDSINIKMEMKTELGDSLVRRKMMNKIIKQYASSKFNEPIDTSTSKQNVFLSPVLLQHNFRPNLPDATPCPICSVSFYGVKVLARHLQAAHPNESTIWEKTLRALNADNVGARASRDGYALENVPKLRPNRLRTKKSDGSERKRKLLPAEKSELYEENGERPPQLEIEENRLRELTMIIYEAHGNNHFSNTATTSTTLTNSQGPFGILRRSTRTTTKHL